MKLKHVFKTQPKIKNSIILLLLIFIAGMYYFFVYESGYVDKFLIKEKFIKYNQNPAAIAHMGYGTELPRSSLAATQKALSSGLEFVDLDVYLSKDDKVIVFHDENLSENTDAFGLITDKTSEELRSVLIQGDKFNMKEYIESLDAHLKETAKFSSVYLLIEVKELNKEKAEFIIDKIQKSLVTYKLSERVFIITRNPLVVCSINSRGLMSGFTFVDRNNYRDFEAKFGHDVLIQKSSWYRLPWYMKSIYMQRAMRKFCPPTILSINYRVNEAIISGARTTGYPFLLWGVDTGMSTEKAIRQQPFGVVSNNPESLNLLIK